MVIGVVNAGGVLPEHWIATIVEAISAGMDVASGLHVRLGSIPAIRDAAERHGAALHDVRHADRTFATGKGTKRPGMRLLTVGTDCSVGKKYTALALEQEMRAPRLRRRFPRHRPDRRADRRPRRRDRRRGRRFHLRRGRVAAPGRRRDHWEIVEGQGSLFHPSFAGVTLGLLHGAQPDAFVVCHEPTRTHDARRAHPLPSIGEVIDLTIGSAG